MRTRSRTFHHRLRIGPGVAGTSRRCALIAAAVELPRGIGLTAFVARLRPGIVHARLLIAAAIRRLRRRAILVLRLPEGAEAGLRAILLRGRLGNRPGLIILRGTEGAESRLLVVLLRRRLRNRAILVLRRSERAEAGLRAVASLRWTGHVVAILGCHLLAAARLPVRLRHLAEAVARLRHLLL